MHGVECRTYSEFRVHLVSAVLVFYNILVPRIVVSALLLDARPAVAQPPTLNMAAGSGPIRTSVRPSTLSTVFFITVFGLVPTVIGTTVTDTIADSLPGVQSRHLHVVPALPQLSAPSPPQLAPLSRRALQTVPSSATDFYRQLHDKSVHSQLPHSRTLSRATARARSALAGGTSASAIAARSAFAGSTSNSAIASATDRQLNDLSVHSQLASSPPYRHRSSSPAHSSTAHPRRSSAARPHRSSAARPRHSHSQVFTTTIGPTYRGFVLDCTSA